MAAYEACEFFVRSKRDDPTVHIQRTGGSHAAHRNHLGGRHPRRAGRCRDSRPGRRIANPAGLHAYFLINCPNLPPFLVTSPPGLFATVGIGTPVVVAPQGLFHGQMPERLVMTCSVTNVATGQTVEGPILIAPTTR